MRGTRCWRAVAVLVLWSGLGQAAELTDVLAEARRFLDQNRSADAITLLEKALPTAKGDQRVLQLLATAYRREIPRLIEVNDRVAAQRFADRLRLIEAVPSKAAAPPLDGGTHAPSPRVHVMVPKATADPSGSTSDDSEEQPAAGARTPSAPLKDMGASATEQNARSPLPNHGAAPQAAGWRPSRVPIRRDVAEADHGLAEGMAPSVPSARVLAAQPSNLETPSTKAVSPQPPSTLSAASGANLLRKADALFVAQRYLEAGELYDAVHRADPATLGVARDRWIYCRLARTVTQINAGPATPTEWATIRSEVQKVLELTPDNTFARSLLAMTERHKGSVLAGGRRDPVVRASEPDADNTKTNLLASLAERIGLGAVADTANRSRWRRFRSGQWQVLESSNFRVFATNDQLAGQIADVAESTRLELYRTWYGKLPEGNWVPKCDIYVHDSAAQYARLTRQGPGSPGHSQTGIEAGRVTSRRVDLSREAIPMADLVNAILPHEVTHVVLTDRFTAQPMPRWADEGMAVLTEPPEKKSAHLKNLGDILKRGRVFSARQLMTMNDYPAGSQWPMFYAQSVSLVDFLVTRSGPAKFIEFMEGSLKHGYEKELQRVYGLAGFDELDRAWSSNRSEQIAAAHTVASRHESQRRVSNL